MFICHGNICRSPMAQSYFTHLVEKKSISHKFIIDSSATSREEISHYPHYGTKSILKENNVKLINHRAKQIIKKEADEFDYLICMDNYNIKNLKRIIDKKNYKKIHLLLDFANVDRNIADPWYTNDFQLTFDDVKLGCDNLLDYLLKNNEL